MPGTSAEMLQIIVRYAFIPVMDEACKKRLFIF